MSEVYFIKIHNLFKILFHCVTAKFCYTKKHRNNKKGAEHWNRLKCTAKKLAEPKGVGGPLKTGTKIRQLSRSDILRPSAVLKKRLAPAAGRHCSPPPARCEIIGNHTDHQFGRAVAAAVTLDMIAVAAPNGSHTVRVVSEGYSAAVVELDDLAPRIRKRECLPHSFGAQPPD